MKVQEHRHNPSIHQNVFLRFLSFLIQPRKVYFHFDDTGICGQCGLPIKAPNIYYHLGIKISYAACGLLSVIFWKLLFPSQTDFIILLLYFLGIIFLYHRIITAVVLAFFEWIPYDTDQYDADERTKHAKNSEYNKLLFAAYGVSISLFVVILQLTLI
jgi:hypothetical protein